MATINDKSFDNSISQDDTPVNTHSMQDGEKDTTKFSFAGGNALTIYINMISMQNMKPCHRESLQKQKRNSMTRWILKQELVQTRGNMLSYEDSLSLAREIKRAFQSSYDSYAFDVNNYLSAVNNSMVRK